MSTTTRVSEVDSAFLRALKDRHVFIGFHFVLLILHYYSFFFLTMKRLCMHDNKTNGLDDDDDDNNNNSNNNNKSINNNNNKFNKLNIKTLICTKLSSTNQCFFIAPISKNVDDD